MAEADFPIRLAGGTVEQSKYDLGKEKEREYSGLEL